MCAQLIQPQVPRVVLVHQDVNAATFRKFEVCVYMYGCPLIALHLTGRGGLDIDACAARGNTSMSSGDDFVPRTSGAAAKWVGRSSREAGVEPRTAEKRQVLSSSRKDASPHGRKRRKTRCSHTWRPPVSVAAGAIMDSFGISYATYEVCNGPVQPTVEHVKALRKRCRT